jgi:DNA-binding transcriptional regulator YdaS (Cro superfamily)
MMPILVENLGELLAKMAALMGGPVTEEELRAAIAWSLRRSKRAGALFERRLRAAKTISGADRIAKC